MCHRLVELVLFHRSSDSYMCARRIRLSIALQHDCMFSVLCSLHKLYVIIFNLFPVCTAARRNMLEHLLFCRCCLIISLSRHLTAVTASQRSLCSTCVRVRYQRTRCVAPSQACPFVLSSSSQDDAGHSYANRAEYEMGSKLQ